MVTSRTLAGAAIFTAFVFAVTFSFAATTSTGGYFDVGEIMVYISALVMGPYVGAFAGGVGSMFSDALLAPQFAPGTLVIKAGEGFIVGYLGKEAFGDLPGRLGKKTGVLLGLMVAAVVFVTGVAAFPDISLSLGQSGLTPTASTPDVPLSWGVWMLLGAVAFVATLALCSRIGPRFTWVSLAILAGGAEMVAGYFLYETQVLQLGLVAPTAEIPVNVLQAVVGLVIAPPVAARVEGAFSKSAAAAVSSKVRTGEK
jgi:uncharacterized membrane protein